MSESIIFLIEFKKNLKKKKKNFLKKFLYVVFKNKKKLYLV